MGRLISSMDYTSYNKKDRGDTSAESEQFLSVCVGEHLLGIPVSCIREVLAEQVLTPIPLAPPQMVGSLNLRGRIIAALSLRKALRLDDLRKEQAHLHVVIEEKSELYSLMVDHIGDVCTVDKELLEKVPSTLDSAWKTLTTGVFRLEHALLVVLDTGALIRQLEKSSYAA